jgi:hypothetical protein
MDEILITYKFYMDAAYYRTVIDRYYRQRPVLLQLPVQFGFLAALVICVYLWNTASSRAAAEIALLIGVLILVGGVRLTKLGILRRFKKHADFGSEATVILSSDGLAASGPNGQRHWAWSAYPRSVRYADGILLSRAGVIRWLPDLAIQQGTPDEATALVASKTALRRVGRQRGIDKAQ